MSKIEELKELIEQANYHRDLYYNKGDNEISDEEYDELFDKIAKLEKETGVIFSNSPTQTVGYNVVSELPKVNHNHPMLSLGKTKDINEISTFLDGRKGVCMSKLDGVSLSILYKDGKLVSAETRGDGAIGENVTHNASAISNIPLTISEKGEVIVDGELIVPLDEFERINSELPEEDRYKSARNLASGSIRQLDSSVARSRKIKFIAWKLIKSAKNCENSFVKEWFYLDELGFDVVPMIELPENLPIDRLEDAVELIKAASAEYKYKIDGCVFGFDDLEYAKSLGKTEHHFNGQLAFKFYDEKYPSVLRDVIWQVGRTGVLSPVAVFDPVEIDGATITRATLHNPAYIQLLGLEIGCTVNIIKANDVIPRVDSCEKGITGITIEYPKTCPACGQEVHFVQSESGKMNLMCKNHECPAKQVAKFAHFVSRDCANIDGLSEATLEKLLSLHLIRSYTDIYHLNRYKKEVSALDGFGEKSWENLWNAIEKSRHIVLSKFINALSIPLIGKKASKSLSKYCRGDIDTFRNVIDSPEVLLDIEDFGPAMVQSITDFNFDEAKVLSGEFIFDDEFAEEVGTTLDGKTFCVTGSLEHFTRKSIEEKIESLGGKMTSSVTSKTDYLVTNTLDSGSSKNKKAQELGINIITEEEFLTMIGE